MKPKILIGAHTSTAGGLQNALLEGQAIGATTVQIFTSNQKQWKGRVITPEMMDLWNQTLDQTGLESIMSHDSYLINLGSANEELLEKSREAFKDEIRRCLQLNLTFLNFHPGAAVGSTVDECLDRIVSSLLSFESLLEGGNLTVLLENTAGQGSSVGYQFEHLASIIERVKGKIPIGVCIDTCHAFAAGYDIRTPEKWNETLEAFDRVVGLNYLKAFHINDSKKGLGTRVDRHDEIGKGEIGMAAFKFLMQDKRTKYLPKYLETPGGPDCWKIEIAELMKFTQ